MRNLAMKTLIIILTTATAVLLLTGTYKVSLPLLMSGSILFVVTTTVAGLYANNS